MQTDWVPIAFEYTSVPHAFNRDLKASTDGDPTTKAGNLCEVPTIRREKMVFLGFNRKHMWCSFRLCLRIFKRAPQQDLGNQPHKWTPVGFEPIIFEKPCQRLSTWITDSQSRRRALIREEALDDRRRLANYDGNTCVTISDKWLGQTHFYEVFHPLTIKTHYYRHEWWDWIKTKTKS